MTICDGENELDTYRRMSFIDLDRVMVRLLAIRMLLISFCDCKSILLATLLKSLGRPAPVDVVMIEVKFDLLRETCFCGGCVVVGVVVVIENEVSGES